jgi:hypothetical protein
MLGVVLFCVCAQGGPVLCEKGIDEFLAAPLVLVVEVEADILALDEDYVADLGEFG